MPPKRKSKADDYLVWTDNEVKMTRGFKAKKGYERVDWESIKDKYMQTVSIFVSNLTQKVGRVDFKYSG